MDYAIDTEGADRVLLLSGQLTFHDQLTGEAALDQLFGAAAERYVIDLKDLISIDSVGLGLLAVARDLATKQNSPIVLRHPGERVSQSLALAKYLDLFPIEK